MATLKKSLEYIENTAGNATYFDFVDDWKPIGHQLYKEVEDLGYVRQTGSGGKLLLTNAGQQRLKELSNPKQQKS